MSNKDKNIENGYLDLVKRFIEKERYPKLLIAGLLFVSYNLLCISLLYVSASLRIVIIPLCCICMYVAVHFFITIVREWKVENHPLWKSITKEENEIVWVYAIKKDLMPFGVQYNSTAIINFKTVAKEHFQLYIDYKHLDDVMKALNRILPRATFGYSQEKEQWYIANPNMMWRK